MHIKYRVCTNCGQNKCLNASEWRMANGLPVGKLCKECVAARRRVLRAEPKQGSFLIDLFKIEEAKLLRIAEYIAHAHLVKNREIKGEPSYPDIQLFLSMRQMSLIQACKPYIEAILAGKV